MTCMKILHVVAGLPPTGGGLAEVVPRLALEPARLGADATIATVAPAGVALSAAAEKAAAEGVLIVRFAPAAPRALFFSWEMRRGLAELVRWADVVHVHSNWTFPVWWASHCALRAGKPLVMSPHGCLDPVRLAHSAWKKRLAGLLDRRYLQRATAIHATSDAELEWIERYVGKGPRICNIPNGVEMPETLSSAPKPVGRMRQVLYLGRLHPLKGLDFLLDAWRLATSAMPIGQQWQLVIAGPDEQGMRQRLQSQAASLGLTDVVFRGPLYGEEKARALADADLVVLPSRSENFGIVVAEALAAGVPVRLATDEPCRATCAASLVGAGIGDTPMDVAALGAPLTPLIAAWQQAGVTHAISIERCGQAFDGRPRNLRGVDIGDFTAPLDELFLGGPWAKLAVGDGGNEIGMGALPRALIAQDVAHGETIACATAADHLIVAGVSNWGAWGLIAALAVLRPDWRDAMLEALDPARDRAILEHAVRHGPAVDGVTALAELTVDSLDMSRHHAKLDAIRAIASKEAVLF